MAKKEKNKNSEILDLKAGDVIKTDKGESFELDAEQAESLNNQANEEKEVDESKEELTPPALKKTGKVKNGTFRFNNKFKK